jgi:protein ImuA
MLALRLAPEKNLFWVQQAFSSALCGELSPAGFLELGFDPSRLVFLRAANPMHALRAAADVLSCKALGAVVLESWGEAGVFDLAASRKLTLVAAQSGAAMIHLRLAATPCTSTAETRWLIESAPSRGDLGHPVFSATLSRNRHGRTGRFLMEWSCDERIFREPAHPRAMAAVPADRPLAAPQAESRFKRAG